MKSKILFIRITIYPIILILALFKIFFSTAFSYAESFDIKNIQISKQFDMNFQKIDVLDEGFKIAYDNLVSNITKSKDQFKLNDLSLIDIKTMIDNFSIKEEKFIDNIYYVSLDVSFNKKKIFSSLEKKNIFPSQPKKKKILFIPVVIEEEKKNIIMFSENIFYQNWIINDDKNQLNYVLPTDDLEDIQIIKSKYENLEDYDFKEIINKYFLDNFIICLIYKNDTDLRVLSKIKLSDKMVLDNRVFKNFSDKSLFNTINELKVLYEDYWKKENQINTSIKLPLAIGIDVLDDQKIEDFERTIKKFDLVSSFNVSKIDNINIYYKVIFNGTPQAFISGMQRSGYNLDIKNKIWILK